MHLWEACGSLCVVAVAVRLPQCACFPLQQLAQTANMPGGKFAKGSITTKQLAHVNTVWTDRTKPLSGNGCKALRKLIGGPYKALKVWAKFVWLQATQHHCAVDRVLRLRNERFLQRRRAQYARASIAAESADSDSEEEEEEEDAASRGSSVEMSPEPEDCGEAAAQEAKRAPAPLLAAKAAAAADAAGPHAAAALPPNCVKAVWSEPANGVEVQALVKDVRKFLRGVLLLLLLLAPAFSLCGSLRIAAGTVPL